VALVMVALGSALAGGVVVALGSRHAGQAKSALTVEPDLYHCPMHPTVVQDHPGDCPICGMKLVKTTPERAATAPAAGSGTQPAPTDSGKRHIAFYRSPMDPRQTSATPRKDEMGMDYLPVYEDEVRGEAPVAGMATVQIDPDRQQLIGLRTTEVVRQQIGGEVRTIGRVAVDETRVRHVNVKNQGFVERIFVDFVGKHVNRGDPLFSVYSPDLLAAEEELLGALRMMTTGGASESMHDANRMLVEAARRKLALWDVPASELARLEQTRQPIKAITLYSPASGVVTKKDVVEGMKLEAGAMPYEIVDLSTVWVLADVYESEIRFVQLGVGATLTLKAFPDRTFEGKVVFIDPFLDPQSRTVKVRLTFPNPTGDLRPEMFGDVVLKIAPHDGLVVPEDAVMSSGTSRVVFVAQGDGKFVPREVELGRTDGKLAEVVRGLEAGERVVTRANFLVDSESRLRASLNSMAAPKLDHAGVLPGAAGDGEKPHAP
jgi:Cu(I)/Ag(I) efflux system membrane fusion protein